VGGVIIGSKIALQTCNAAVRQSELNTKTNNNRLCQAHCSMINNNNEHHQGKRLGLLYSSNGCPSGRPFIFVSGEFWQQVALNTDATGKTIGGKARK